MTFLNTNFVVALLASMASAYFGATVAQKVILRNKKKEELEVQLRNTNSAITMAVTICNMGLALKKQLIKPLYDAYILDQEKFIDFEGNKAENVGKTFHFEADLQSFGTTALRIKNLENILFDKVNTPSRALSAVAFVELSHSSLIGRLNNTRALISKFS